MGNMEWILGLAVLAAGGWCFLAGPCKGWLGQLTNGGGGSDQHALYRTSGNDPAVKAAAVNNIIKYNKISRSQAEAQYQDYLSKL